MRDLEREGLRREWRRIQAVDAKVVELRRVKGPRGHDRWIATVESALERRASVSAVTPAVALRRARRKLGYVDVGKATVLQSEIPLQVAWP